MVHVGAWAHGDMRPLVHVAACADAPTPGCIKKDMVDFMLVLVNKILRNNRHMKSTHYLYAFRSL